MSRALPRFELPEPGERPAVGTLVAALVHAVLVGLLLLPAPVNEPDYFRGLGTPALVRGGGDGGRSGARVVSYVDLAAPVPAPRTVTVADPPLPSPRVRPVRDRPPEERLEPQVTDELPVVAVRRAPTDGQVTAPVTGSARDGGAGPGTGGGIGAGQGQGVGAGSGPGTGGDGGTVLAPRPRASPFPFDDPPDELQGVALIIRFFVDERGRVRRIAIEPEVQDRGYRGKLVDVFESWTFYAARTLDGRAVPGEFVIRFLP